MSLSVGGTIGAGAALSGINQAMSDLSALTGGYLSSYFGRRNAKWSNEHAFDYYKAQRKLDWDYFLAENEQNYQLAQRYAENSAKWQMQGLNNAGLNPILALNGHMPDVQQVPSASPMGGSLPNVSVDGSTRSSPASVSAAIRDVAGTQMMLSSAKKATAESDIPVVAAEKLRSETEQIKANTAKTLATTSAELSRINAETSLTKSRERLTDRQREIADRPHTAIAETADWAVRRATDAIKSLFDFTDTWNLFNTLETDPSKTLIKGSPIHSGKSKADAEKQLQKIQSDLIKKYKDRIN